MSARATSSRCSSLGACGGAHGAGWGLAVGQRGAAQGRGRPRPMRNRPGGGWCSRCWWRATRAVAAPLHVGGDAPTQDNPNANPVLSPTCPVTRSAPSHLRMSASCSSAFSRSSSVPASLSLASRACAAATKEAHIVLAPGGGRATHRHTCAAASHPRRGAHLWRRGTSERRCAPRLGSVRPRPAPPPPSLSRAKPRLQRLLLRRQRGLLLALLQQPRLKVPHACRRQRRVRGVAGRGRRAQLVAQRLAVLLWRARPRRGWGALGRVAALAIPPGSQAQRPAVLGSEFAVPTRRIPPCSQSLPAPTGGAHLPPKPPSS